MAMIGDLNTRIKILKRKEIGGNSDPFAKKDVEYDLVLETWAKAEYSGATKKFNDRVVGKDSNDTTFIMRNPRIELEKDHYITAKGYKYQVEATKPADDKLRFISADCSFIGKYNDEG